LKKDLRKFLTYNGEKLVNLDIKNSQPLLSGILLNPEFYTETGNFSIHTLKSLNKIIPNNKYQKFKKTISSLYINIMLVISSETIASKEFEDYLKIVQEGTLYEEIFNVLHPGRPLSRENRAKIKEIVFTIFYADNRHGPRLRKIGLPFKRRFPNIFEIFSLLKRNNKIIFSHILQKTESQLIIEIITKRIAKERPELPIFTVHDSISTTLGNEKYVKQVMKEEIKKLTGLDANIGRENWYEENVLPVSDHLKSKLNWISIPGFESLYEISDTGIIKSLHPSRKGQILAARIDRAGYFTVRLTRKGKTVTKYLHRLLAEAFLIKPCEKNYVNHKNGNKQDNRLDNLEWTTQKDNVLHAYANGLIKKSVRRVFDTCTGIKYKSAKHAALMNGLNYSTCKNYLNGNRANPTCLQYAA
jgi:hypothetical protein